jgi:hypothetical protein
MEAALRQATTQLTQWLARDYALTPSEAAIVLGTTIEYDMPKWSTRNSILSPRCGKPRWRD